MKNYFFHQKHLSAEIDSSQNFSSTADLTTAEISCVSGGMGFEITFALSALTAIVAYKLGQKETAGFIVSILMYSASAGLAEYIAPRVNQNDGIRLIMEKNTYLSAFFCL